MRPTDSSYGKNVFSLCMKHLHRVGQLFLDRNRKQPKQPAHMFDKRKYEDSADAMLFIFFNMEMFACLFV